MKRHVKRPNLKSVSLSTKGRIIYDRLSDHVCWSQYLDDCVLVRGNQAPIAAQKEILQAYKRELAKETYEKIDELNAALAHQVRKLDETLEDLNKRDSPH